MFAKESVLPKYCLARTPQIPKFLRSQLEKVSLFANFPSSRVHRICSKGPFEARMPAFPCALPTLPTMRSSFLLSALLGLLTTSLAHNIQMGAHQRECFHEVLHKDDKMTVTFQVGDREFGGAGNLELDFWVSGLHRRITQGAKG